MSIDYYQTARNGIKKLFEKLGDSATFKKETHTSFNDRGEPISQFTDTQIDVIPMSGAYRYMNIQDMGDIDMAAPDFAVLDTSVVFEPGDMIEYQGRMYKIDKSEEYKIKGKNVVVFLEAPVLVE